MTENIRIYNKSARTAVIDIEGVIGVDENVQFDDPETGIATYERFKAAVEGIRRLKTPHIIVNIRSAGGDVNDALLIHDGLAALDARITTRCYGYIASAATIIAQAASPGRREISSNSLYLIHNAVSRAEGNSKALTQTLDLLRKTDLRIAAIYAARSGRDAERFLELMDENGGNGRWLSPEEVISLGLADKIIKAAPAGNDAPKQILNLRPPQIPETTYLKPQTMNINKKWKEILSLIGIPAGKEAEVDDRMLEAIDHRLAQQALRIEELEHMMPADEAAAQVVQLQQRVAELETQNARLNAKATLTLPREDPAPAGDDAKVLSPNQNAYEEDVRGFSK